MVPLVLSVSSFLPLVVFFSPKVLLFQLSVERKGSKTDEKNTTKGKNEEADKNKGTN